MNAFFDTYEARELPVTHSMIARAWTVTGGQKDYRIELTVRGEWTCTCPSYGFHGRKERPASCKHTRFVEDLVKKSV